MKIEKQVVSLELAKQLKDNGYPQKEGLWWWVESYWGDGTMLRWDIIAKENLDKVNGNQEFVAPTVVELGEALPMEPEPKTYFETTRIAFGNWIVEYKKGIRRPLAMQMGNTEADARAKMWLYLKKESLL